ncbi:type IV pilus assembly protein PilA [Clostridium moniliforme]|uniref:Type IV pilus assembly protein PilA n=1 Tax=Clostridium moniliforme TaxID=39489 RepID=A0ABS4F358_9CLOT|nr:prepilin-type N-terminal cleavage/methylation domain-containing protein [Clostridium moniliforme]MBP1890704.1 type IV pilus assembly protein PilA [Clostridium moniliforme]
MNQIIKFKKKKKGFTLIELVAVVAIMGILATIFVPKITGYMNEAKKTRVMDQARKVVMAVDTYEMKQNKAFSGSKVSDVISNNITKEYLGGSGITLENTLPNLKADTNISDCRDIIESNKYFKLDENDKFESFIAENP